MKRIIKSEYRRDILNILLFLSLLEHKSEIAVRILPHRKNADLYK